MPPHQRYLQRHEEKNFKGDSRRKDREGEVNGLKMDQTERVTKFGFSFLSPSFFSLDIYCFKLILRKNKFLLSVGNSSRCDYQFSKPGKHSKVEGLEIENRKEVKEILRERNKKKKLAGFDPQNKKLKRCLLDGSEKVFDPANLKKARNIGVP